MLLCATSQNKKAHENATNNVICCETIMDFTFPFYANILILLRFMDTITQRTCKQHKLYFYGPYFCITKKQKANISEIINRFLGNEYDDQFHLLKTKNHINNSLQEFLLYI